MALSDRDPNLFAQALRDDSPASQTAADQLAASIESKRSRRSLLRGTAVGAAGLALGGGLLFNASSVLAAPRASNVANTSIPDILSIAATAEALAVAFYGMAIQHHRDLGIFDSDLAYLKAAQVEEQIHFNYLTAAGGAPLTTRFSTPHGPGTFLHKKTFVSTLVALETNFVAAYLAAVKEFAEQGQPGLAQVAAQVCGVESEHRTLARDIGELVPADNVAYEAALLARVSDAVGALSSGGFLSPTAKNYLQYKAISLRNLQGVTHTQP